MTDEMPKEIWIDEIPEELQKSLGKWSVFEQETGTPKYVSADLYDAALGVIEKCKNVLTPGLFEEDVYALQSIRDFKEKVKL